MREILFRGKRIDSGEWVEGFVWVRHPRAAAILVLAETEPAAMEPMGVDYCVRPETIGQYTGLQDKNGVKIFEGDIVIANQEREKDTAVITFDNGAFTAQPVTGKILEKTLWEYWWNDWDLEVIGNIYDNPDLLKVTP